MELGIFKDCECLTNNEVYEYLKDDDNERFILKNIVKFLEQVKSNLAPRHIKEIREYLKRFDLSEFEVAKIIDLLPGVLEEFKDIIPSVSEKHNDIEINKIIIFLNKYNFIILDSDDGCIKRPIENEEKKLTKRLKT